MLRLVILKKLANVSEEPSASFFRVGVLYAV